MVLKKIDNRIRVLIENGVQQKHRSIFFVVGEKARDQVKFIFACILLLNGYLHGNSVKYVLTVQCYLLYIKLVHSFFRLLYFITCYQNLKYVLAHLFCGAIKKN